MLERLGETPKYRYFWSQPKDTTCGGRVQSSSQHSFQLFRSSPMDPSSSSSLLEGTGWTHSLSTSDLSYSKPKGISFYSLFKCKYFQLFLNFFKGDSINLHSFERKNGRRCFLATRWPKGTEELSWISLLLSPSIQSCSKWLKISHNLFVGAPQISAPVHWFGWVWEPSGFFTTWESLNARPGLVIEFMCRTCRE